MKWTWTGAGLLAASLLALPLTARADDRDWRDDDRYRDGRYQDYRYDQYGRYSPYGQNGRGRNNVTFGYGFDRGFREGQDKGSGDARSRRAFDPARHGAWRDTDKGYRSSYGPRPQYERGYRAGFEQGYRAAFDTYYGRAGNRNDPYGRYGYDPYGPYDRYARPRN